MSQPHGLYLYFEVKELQFPGYLNHRFPEKDLPSRVVGFIQDDDSLTPQRLSIRLSRNTDFSSSTCGEVRISGVIFKTPGDKEGDVQLESISRSIISATELAGGLPANHESTNLRRLGCGDVVDQAPYFSSRNDHLLHVERRSHQPVP